MMAQSIVEQGHNNKWCKTHSIGSLKYKNLKLREKEESWELKALKYGRPAIVARVARAVPRL